MSKRELLSRAAILDVPDLPEEEVYVEQWKGYVRVRGLTAGERDAFESSVIGGDGKVQTKDLRARLVALSVIDGDGKRMFKDGDIPALSKKSAAPINTIFATAQRLNGISKGDVEDLEKNSDATTDDGSSSD